MEHQSLELQSHELKNKQQRDWLAKQSQQILLDEKAARRQEQALHAARLAEIEAARKKHDDKVGDLLRQSEILAQIIANQEAQTRRLHESITGLHNVQTTETESLATIRGAITVSEVTLDNLRQQERALTSVRDATQAEVMTLDERKAAKKHEFDALVAAQADKQADMARRTDLMSAKLAEIEERVRTQAKSLERELDDVARRKMQLDQREVVLRTREHKVEQGERAVQRNANLLDL